MKISKFILISLAVLFLFSCKKELKEKQCSGSFNVSYYSVVYFSDEEASYCKEIDSLLNEVDNLIELDDTNSVLSKINRNEDVEIHPMLAELFKKTHEISSKTSGTFDITVGGLVELCKIAFEQGQVDIKSNYMVDSLVKYVGYDKISIKGNHLYKTYPQMDINMDAVARGYAITVLDDFLRTHHIENYLIDVGGTIRTKGTKPNAKKWIVGIEIPEEVKQNSSDAMTRIELQNQSLSTSGNYSNFYEKEGLRYSCTIDPHTGYPVSHTLLSVSVLSNNAIESDGIATAFMVMGLEKSLEFVKKNPQYEAYFIYSQNGHVKTCATKGMQKLIDEYNKKYEEKTAK